MGISFFTFKALGYILDVYHQRIMAGCDFLTYALFVSFFPSIVAGLIDKASLEIPYLKALRPYFDYGKAVAGLKIACLEGIAYRKGWISEEKMRELAKPMVKNLCGQYLLKVIDEMKEEVNSINILGKTNNGRVIA